MVNMLKVWTEEEVEYLKANYNKIGIKESCVFLKRSYKAINNKALRLGIKIKRIPKCKPGEIYGRLTLIKRMPWKNNRGSYWHCKCECGNQNYISVRQDSLINGHTSSCGCLHRDRIKKDPGFSTYTQKFYHYKSNAKRRKIEFSLNFEDFIKIIKKNCFYCDIKPSEYNYYLKSDMLTLTNPNKRALKETIDRATVHINGIDRINSKLGYLKNNSVPCCADCNTMKMSLSIEDFLNKIVFIYNRIDTIKNNLITELIDEKS